MSGTSTGKTTTIAMDEVTLGYEFQEYLKDYILARAQRQLEASSGSKKEKLQVYVDQLEEYLKKFQILADKLNSGNSIEEEALDDYHKIAGEVLELLHQHSKKYKYIQLASRVEQTFASYTEYCFKKGYQEKVHQQWLNGQGKNEKNDLEIKYPAITKEQILAEGDTKRAKVDHDKVAELLTNYNEARDRVLTAVKRHQPDVELPQSTLTLHENAKEFKENILSTIENYIKNLKEGKRKGKLSKLLNKVKNTNSATELLDIVTTALIPNFLERSDSTRVKRFFRKTFGRNLKSKKVNQLLKAIKTFSGLEAKNDPKFDLLSVANKRAKKLDKENAQRQVNETDDIEISDQVVKVEPQIESDLENSYKALKEYRKENFNALFEKIKDDLEIKNLVDDKTQENREPCVNQEDIVTIEKALKPEEKPGWLSDDVTKFNLMHKKFKRAGIQDVDAKHSELVRILHVNLQFAEESNAKMQLHKLLDEKISFCKDALDKKRSEERSKQAKQVKDEFAKCKPLDDKSKGQLEKIQLLAQQVIDACEAEGTSLKEGLKHSIPLMLNTIDSGGAGLKFWEISCESLCAQAAKLEEFFPTDYKEIKSQYEELAKYLADNHPQDVGAYQNVQKNVVALESVMNEFSDKVNKFKDTYFHHDETNGITVEPGALMRLEELTEEVEFFEHMLETVNKQTLVETEKTPIYGNNFNIPYGQVKSYLPIIKSTLEHEVHVRDAQYQSLTKLCDNIAFSTSQLKITLPKANSEEDFKAHAETLSDIKAKFDLLKCQHEKFLAKYQPKEDFSKDIREFNETINKLEQQEAQSRLAEKHKALIQAIDGLLSRPKTSGKKFPFLKAPSSNGLDHTSRAALKQVKTALSNFKPEAVSQENNALSKHLKTENKGKFDKILDTFFDLSENLHSEQEISALKMLFICIERENNKPTRENEATRKEMLKLLKIFLKESGYNETQQSLVSRYLTQKKEGRTQFHTVVSKEDAKPHERDQLHTMTNEEGNAREYSSFFGSRNENVAKGGGKKSTNTGPTKS
jgi:hypothetical protein